MNRMIIVAVAASLSLSCSDATPDTADAWGGADALPVDAAIGADGGVSCNAVHLGAGLRADIAAAAGHFAVSYIAVGLDVAVRRFTEEGNAVSSAVLPGTEFSILRPAIAGRETFLLAHVAPTQGSIALTPLNSDGSFGATVQVVPAPTLTDVLRLAASHVNGEFALTYFDVGMAKFARVATDGTVLAGPVALATAPDVYVSGVSYRPGGWALAAKLSMMPSSYLLLVDNDGALVSEVALPDGALPGDVVWTGTEIALTLWDGLELRLRRMDENGTALAQDTLLASDAWNPGGLAFAAGGYTASYVDSAKSVHIVHSDELGVVDSDYVVGTGLDALFTPTAVAVSSTGARGIAWHLQPSDQVPMSWAAFNCP